MKTTAVVESLSYYKTNVLFQRIPAYFKIVEFIVSVPYQERYFFLAEGNYVISNTIELSTIHTHPFISSKDK